MIALKTNRRDVIGALGAAILMKHALPSVAREEERLVVRTPGGSRDDVLREVLYKPFAKATGIEIIPVAANTGKMLAMAKIGASEMDVVDDSTDNLTPLARAGALQPIPYSDFKYADPADFDPSLVTRFHIANATYATLLGYDPAHYPRGRAPKSWAEFWDIKAFPGPRSLGSMDANGGDLEFALLADGVPMDKLYPLDLDRAFKSLSRIRPAIVKFWESGGMSTQMLIDREVVLSSIWSTRLAIAIEKGASLAAEWNQCRIEVQAYGIFKNTKNLSGATKFVDYATSADIQRKTYRQLPALPSNKKAYGAASKTLFNPATGEPWMTERGFMMDADYWAQHRKQTEAYWSDWIVK